MVLHITGSGVSKPFTFKLVEQLFRIFAQSIHKNVQAAPMRHTQNDFFGAIGACTLDQLIKTGNKTLCALKAKALDAGITGTKVFFQAFGRRQALKDMRGGILDFMAGNPGFVRANGEHVRVLTALSDLQSVQDIFGGVPLIAESEALDYPLTGLAPMGWSWYVVPNGTPEEHVEVLREAMAAALERPEVKEYFDSIGRPLLGYPPEDYIDTVDAVREQLSTATDAIEWEAEKLDSIQ